MAAVLSLLGVLLLMQGCSLSLGETGCKLWKPKGDDVCCEACHAGNRRVAACGPNPKELCQPCKPNTFSNSFSYMCTRCRQCAGALYTKANCTATTDTKCGCKKGRCADETCTYCIPDCVQGEEPTDKNSCRPCPNGTFSDKMNSKCKPWSRCLDSEKILSHGDASTDIKCGIDPPHPQPAPSHPVKNPERPVLTDQSISLAVYVVAMILMAFIIILTIIVLTIKIHHIKKKTKTKTTRQETNAKTTTPSEKFPIIMPPTDDPCTLIAIECSFHEAQQEQGSSTESLASKESSKQLIG